MNMRTRMRLAVSSLALCAAAAASAAHAETTLTFVWHAGTCADARRGFPDVEALTAFLQSEMAKTAQGDEPAVSTPGCGANAASGNSSTDTGC